VHVHVSDLGQRMYGLEAVSKSNELPNVVCFSMVGPERVLELVVDRLGVIRYANYTGDQFNIWRVSGDECLHCLFPFASVVPLTFGTNVLLRVSLP
jgi:hypothetical protein